MAGTGCTVSTALACVCAGRVICTRPYMCTPQWRYTPRHTLWLRQMLHPARGEANPAASTRAGTAVPWAAPVPAALCARAVAWGFFVRRAGQVPPPRLPTGPGSERPPRSKSAAFAYSEQVGAHMPKMHQTKLATIIIIKCAVVLGGGRAWQTSRIIMKLSMCAAVLQQLCLAQQAGNDACYSHPPSPARPPVARSREGCASLGPPRDALGKGARGQRGAVVRLRPGLWLGGRRGLGKLPSAPRVLQAPSRTLLLWQHPRTKPTPNPLPVPPVPGCSCPAWRATRPLRTKEPWCSSITKISLYLPPAAFRSPSSSSHPALCRGVLSPTHPLRGLATRAVAGGDTPDSSPSPALGGHCHAAFP